VPLVEFIFRVFILLESNEEIYFMNDIALAATFALITALIAAPMSVIVRRGQVHGNAMTGVIIGLAVNLPLLAAATVILWEPSWWNLEAIMFFLALGVAGPSLGRFFMYQSIHHLGVARSMPLISTLPLTTAVAAYGLLGERPGPYIWAGTLLVVAGCAALTLKGKADAVWNRRYLWFPLMSVAGFTAGNVIRKMGLGVLPSPLFGVTLTYFSGLIFLLLLRNFLPPAHQPDLRWGRRWNFYGLCGMCNTLSILTRFTATQYGNLTIVVPLFGMSAVFALISSWLFLRDVERITLPVAGGAIFVMLGGALVAWRVL
jgi:drug/metabolite transporter (DMT)-like permease